MASGNINMIFTLLNPSKVSWAFFFSPREKAENPDKQQCPSGHSGPTFLALQTPKATALFPNVLEQGGVP